MAQEKSFENKIKKYLNTNDCWHVKYFANRMTKSGVPDILANVNGYFVAIEVKADKGKSSELQLWNREQIRKAGGICVIVYPDQWEELKLLLDDLLHRSDKCIWEEQYDFDR